MNKQKKALMKQKMIKMKLIMLLHINKNQLKNKAMMLIV